MLLALDSLNQRNGRPRRGAIWRRSGSADLWWFCLFYSVTFGGYVGLSSFLPLFLRAQHGVDAGTAGLLTALAAFAGSGARPFGGWLADRVGGTRLLGMSLAGLALTYAGIATGPAFVPLIGLLVLAMACCGCGNGAVFQLVPLRFRNQVGLATGVIGAIGGLGGFCLPMLLGLLRQHQGSASDRDSCCWQSWQCWLRDCCRH